MSTQMGAIDEKPALEGRVERLVDLTRKTVPMTRMNRIAIVAAMTLCRAYCRTRDPALEAPAQATLDFIMAAQHAGGGWRYQPMQPGDTSALSYQREALANGEAAGLKVKPEPWKGVARFLDSVQGDAAGSWQAHERLDRAWFSSGPLVSTSLAALTLAEPLDRIMLRAK